MANTQVRCPNCGSFATKPTHGEGGLGRNQDTLAMLFGNFTFDNSGWVRKFKNAEVKGVCETCKFVFAANTVLAQTNAQMTSPKKTTVERLAELDQLRVNRIITEDEYQRKREEILREL